MRCRLVGLRLVTWFFRKCGAYFMRRTFSGDVLYSAIFGEYSKQLLEARTPIEFFIEGTRARAGERVGPQWEPTVLLLRVRLRYSAQVARG